METTPEPKSSENVSNFFPNPLTNLYAQVIGYVDYPKSYPIKIMIEAFTRNAKFEQTAILQKATGGQILLTDIEVIRDDNNGKSKCDVPAMMIIP